MASSSEETLSRIVELESKLSFQDDTIEKLNHVITDQQQQLDMLNARIEKLVEWAKQQQQSDIATQNEEAPPPHY